MVSLIILSPNHLLVVVKIGKLFKHSFLVSCFPEETLKQVTIQWMLQSLSVLFTENTGVVSISEEICVVDLDKLSILQLW